MVYVPVDGGNDWSSAAYDVYAGTHTMRHEDHTYDESGQAWLTSEQAFLDARALIEVQDSTGVWWMLVSHAAGAYVYECSG